MSIVSICSTRSKRIGGEGEGSERGHSNSLSHFHFSSFSILSHISSHIFHLSLCFSHIFLSHFHFLFEFPLHHNITHHIFHLCLCSSHIFLSKTENHEQTKEARNRTTYKYKAIT